MTFRDMANNTNNKHQWIVLDGDIDAGKHNFWALPALTVSGTHARTHALNTPAHANAVLLPQSGSSP